VNVLISNSPPAVNADAHDHGERRPNKSDATRVHTPMASTASAMSRVKNYNDRVRFPGLGVD